MFFGRVFHSASKFGLLRTRISFCYARESSSRIFLSSVGILSELWRQQLGCYNMFSAQYVRYVILLVYTLLTMKGTCVM